MDAWTVLEEVSFVRRRRLILDRINWRIAPGSHWVLLGANGSGKTTLLQLLAGYLWPSEGRLTVLGHPFGRVDLRELRRSIGWVGSFLQAQIPPAQLPLDLVVSGKYASLGLFAQPTAEDHRQALELAAQLHCAHVLETPYGMLSQGEKQRFLLARALIHQPRLLILDEPCAGLDLPAREQLLQTLERLGRGPHGPTMILVTHHLEEIMPVWSHVLLLKQGRCVAQGEKEAVLVSDLLTAAFEFPLTVTRDGERYSARLVASP
jgi:iron complex transport system ATP-binding protein